MPTKGIKVSELHVNKRDRSYLEKNQDYQHLEILSSMSVQMYTFTLQDLHSACSQHHQTQSPPVQRYFFCLTKESPQRHVHHATIKTTAEIQVNLSQAYTSWLTQYFSHHKTNTKLIANDNILPTASLPQTESHQDTVPCGIMPPLQIK